MDRYLRATFITLGITALLVWAILATGYTSQPFMKVVRLPPYGHHRDGQAGRMGDQRQERNSGHICRGRDDKRKDSSQQASTGP